jgi:hypothetical protein
MSSQSSIKEKLENVVARASTIVLPVIKQADSTIQAVSFQMAPWEEICQKLIDQSKNAKLKFFKFPLIAIQEVFPTIRGVRYPELTLQCYIMHHTNKNYNSSERDGKIFEPILQPIRQEFIKQIALSKYFYGPIAATFSYTEFDNKYVGKENIFPEGSPIAEYVDVVYLKDLKLYLNTTC